MPKGGGMFLLKGGFYSQIHLPLSGLIEQILKISFFLKYHKRAKSEKIPTYSKIKYA